MRRQPEKLRVFPNPWGVPPSVLFDREGKTLENVTPNAYTLDPVARACGFVPEEARSRVAPTVARYVGARIDDAHTRKLQKLRRGDDLRSERQETVFTFLGCSAHETRPLQLAEELSAKQPLELTWSRYLVDRIIDGSLIAADQKTAKAAGVRFFEPKSLFRPLAEAAARAFNAQFEDDGDVYAEMCEARDAAAKAAEAAKNPKATEGTGGAPIEVGTKTGDLVPAPGAQSLPDESKPSARRASRNKTES